jgi:hypothetical protein
MRARPAARRIAAAAGWKRPSGYVQCGAWVAPGLLYLDPAGSLEALMVINAALESAAMTMPLTTAFWDWAPDEKSKIQGEASRTTPRIRFATSQNLASVQLSWHISFETTDLTV